MGKLLIALMALLIMFLHICFIRSVGRINQKYDELVYERFFREEVQTNE